MSRYRIAGTLSISDGPGCDWAGQRIPGAALVGITEATVEAETPRQALGRVARECALGWRYWEPWDVTVWDVQGRVVLSDDRAARFYLEQGLRHEEEW